MNTIRLCPGCGGPLSADALAGLCPQCLLKTQVIGEEELAHAMPRVVPLPGAQFGDYRIVKLLGHGGMGEVYEAEHVTTARRVALKVMRHTLVSEQDRKRFLREGRLAASVNHPNVVYIHGSEEINGAPAIAMELVHGGTLKDRLKREGPLPIADGVEAALQIIDGLEAAHAAGVLHRDIKPANCFIATDGSVKVGDFGLSVSTLARGESLITATGAVMGTPAYASPEQLRGEELDVTSDIYSVGATLYHLLTGKTPFNSTDFVKLITEVLDKQPAPPKSLRAEIPPELSKILLRCLAKERSARFQSYTELRDALLPFRAVEVTPANPGVRFLAALPDDMLAYGPSLLFLIYWSLDPLDKLAHERTLHALFVWLPFYAWYLAYYAVSEGLWGAAIGKSICGLRVVGRDDQRPGVAPALLRVFIYSLPFTLPSWILMATVPLARLSSTYQPSEWLTGREGSAITDWLWMPLTALLFVTMRHRNGYAAIQDLLSRTRVIVRPTTQPRPRLEPGIVPPMIPMTAKLPGFGPYQATARLWKTNDEELVLAFDPALQRKVWVHLRPLNAAPVSEARRDLSRAGRLRWINHGETGTQRWDAYEALDGAPFSVVATRAQPWNAVRFWLLDLAEEIAAAMELPQTAPSLDVERLWITTSGRAVLLEFPAEGAAAAEATLLSPEPLQTAQKFLDQVARLSLQGAENARSETSGEPIQAPLPLHARSFLTSLAHGTFDHARFIVGNLQSLISKAAEVSRPRRVASLAFVPLVIFALGGALTGIVSFDRIRWNRAWAAAYPQAPSMRAAAELYESRKEAMAEGKTEAKDFEAVGVYIAMHYSEIITNDATWSSPIGQLLGDSERDALKEAAKKFSEPTAAQFAAAERNIPKRLARHEREIRFLGIKMALGMAVFIPLMAMITGVLSALAFRISPLLRLFGIAIVKRNGSPLSRWHLALRLLVTWVPVTAILFLSISVAEYFDETLTASFWPLLVPFFALVLLLVPIIYAALRPTAGVPDLITRTRLVPI